LVTVLACVVVVVSGCARTSSGPSGEQAVRDAVAAYNRALADAFAQMDMNLLQGTATEAQAGSEAVMMQSLGNGGVRMLATLVSIEFGDVVFSAEGTAVVETTEVWDYRHESLDTSETVRAEQGVVYRLRYDLVLQDGRWLVDGVTSLDEAESGTEETSAP
jgi:hypothetical protein